MNQPELNDSQPPNHVIFIHTKLRFSIKMCNCNRCCAILYFGGVPTRSRFKKFESIHRAVHDKLAIYEGQWMTRVNAATSWVCIVSCTR